MARKKNAVRDGNRVPTLIGVASETITVGGVDYIQGVTPVNIAVNPTTHAVVVEEA